MTEQPKPSDPMPSRPTAGYTEKCEYKPCLPVCKKTTKSTDDEGKATIPHMVLRCAPSEECLAANAECVRSIQQAQKELGYRLSDALKDFTTNNKEVHQH